jgi:mercuric reductase
MGVTTMNHDKQIEIVELDIRGMTCDDCAHHVGSALQGVEGVEEATVPGWKSRRAEVKLAAGTPSGALVEAVRAAGYGAKVTARRGLEGAGNKNEVREGRDYDLIVLGTGGAGMAAAIRAAESGYRTAIVEAGVVGGTCVNIGCVPSKTLIRAAEAFHRAGHHSFEGVRTRAEGVDWPVLIRQKDELVTGLRQQKYIDVLASYGKSISLFRGRAALRPDGSIGLDDGRVLTAGKIIIATGASPRILPLRGIEEVPVLTSTSLMALDRMPESLIVIGGRAVALELGQALQRFGTRVTVLQRSDALLPDHEPEVSEAIERYLAEEGVEVRTGARPTAIRREGAEAVVTATVNGKEREYRAEQVLMAVGRIANTGKLGLKEAGIEVDEQGFIIVDEEMRTGNPKVYAAGDVTNHPKLVYVAAAGGGVAAENALSGTRTPLDLSVLPEVVFTDPQVASVGLTERDARAAGHNVKTSILPLEYVPRALAARDTRGLVKLVADADTDKLLGGHVVAPEGGEIIQTVTLSIKFGISLADLVGTLFPYLTLGEGIKLAAQTFDKDVAKLSCCAG